MNDITIDDLKNVLLDLYLSQRENAQLRAELTALRDNKEAPEGAVDEGV